MEYLNNSLEQAIADLRKTVESNPNRDRFPVGTVIRWTASGRYTYLAVKTDYAWFTTARPGNPFVPQQLDYEDLQEILSRAETTDIAVATAWSALDGTSVPDPGLPTQAFGRRPDWIDDREAEDGYGMMPGLGGSGEHV